MDKNKNMICHTLVLLFFVSLTQGSVFSKDASEVVNMAKRLVGGQPAAENSHPWAVYFDIKHNVGTSKCSGTIIDKEWVLGTAQCFLTNLNIFGTPYNLEEVTAKFGKVDLNKKEPGEISMKIPLENIIRYDGFHQELNRQAKVNNIALIRLPQPLVYSYSIKNITLPEVMEGISHFNKKPVTLIGWGSGTQLTEAKANIISREDCQKEYPRVNHKVFCLKDPKISTCVGDGGGSIEYNRDDGTTVLVGMNSFSKIEPDGSCKPGQISGAVYVPLFMSWIHEKTGL